MKSIRTATSVAALAIILTLTGCGSDDAGTAASSTPSQDVAPTPPPGRGLDQAKIEQIRECLEAAGLEDTFPTDMPSGAPSNMPSDMPSEMPSGFDPENLPEGLPSDGPAGGGFGGFAALQDPKVQDALKACGIELPQQPAAPSN